uniref:Arginase n=1 Tax=Panagrellus redivivus TaxID=6233 RepID=A0A7E4W9C8_PANRE
MPFAIPALKYSNLERDPPLSVLGRFSAIARAKSMHHQRIKIDLILTPPSLRCVQTAAAYTSVYKRAHIIVLPDLVEPEVILENGVLTTTHGEYMNIETLRRTGLEVHESGFIDSQPLPKASETPLQAMKRIHDAIIEIISKIPGGPLLIIGDCVVLKVAETMASVPEGYLDLLADVPFKVPDLLNEAVQEMTEFDCDFTELREHYPYGSTSVFRKNRDGKLHRLQRLPVVLHPVTVSPGQKQQTHLKPEVTEGSQQEPVQTGSEVAVN